MMSLYAVKNNKGEWLSFGSSHESVWDTNNPMFFKDRIYAEIQSIGRKAHLVELLEAPAKVVVSEDEAEMLEKASNLRDWRPAAVISKYAYEHERNSCDDEVILEDRLMRAYVNGWTVEKPKRWNVKVPHVDEFYWVSRTGKLCVTHGREERGHAAQFTAAEIEHYGLQDCERVEVTDDEQ